MYGRNKFRNEYGVKRRANTKTKNKNKKKIEHVKYLRLA